MGKWGYIVNIIMVVWTFFEVTILCFPETYPLTWDTFNYAVRHQPPSFSRIANEILRLLSLWPSWVYRSCGTSLLVDDTTTVPEATSTNTLLKRRNPMNHKRRHQLSAVQHAPMANASTRRPLAGSVHVMTLKTQLFNQRAYFAIL